MDFTELWNQGYEYTMTSSGLTLPQAPGTSTVGIHSTSEKCCIHRLSLVSWSGATCCCVPKPAAKPALWGAYHFFLFLLWTCHSCQCLGVRTSTFLRFSKVVVHSSVALAIQRTTKSLTVLIHWLFSTRSWGGRMYIALLCPEEWDQGISQACEWGILLNKGRYYMEWAVLPAPSGCA